MLLVKLKLFQLNSTLDKLKQEAVAKMNSQQASTAISPLTNGAGEGAAAAAATTTPMKILMMDDDYRSKQYGPTEPTVKILRRPSHERNDRSAVDAKPKAPVKTLQQRKHEYAQARLRILGAECSPEEAALVASPPAITPTTPFNNSSE